MNKHSIERKIPLNNLKRIQRIMRATLFLMLFSILIVKAETSYSQEALTIKLKSASIKEVCKEIEKNSDYIFVFSDNSEAELQKQINVNTRIQNIQELLNDIFNNTTLGYKILEKQIVVHNTAEQGSTVLGKSPSQENWIKGSIKDTNGTPLIGVSIQVKGFPNRGGVTDEHGNFTISLRAEEEKVTLVFSYIGYKTIEMNAAPFSALKLVMQEDIAMLEGVVITGMQVVKKEEMTGSTFVLTPKDLKEQGITSIDRIFDGMIPGLNSTTVSGAPGVRSQIIIRGENTLNGNSEPLWIVDGLPLMQGVPKSNGGNYAQTIMQDGVGNIMPQDIESITILKDAAASAIYGARAANGVIVITTKKGFRSKFQVNYTGNYQVGMAPNVDLGMMNSKEKLQYEKSIVDNFGQGYAYRTGRGGFLYHNYLNGNITSEAYQTEIDRLSNTNTNWLKEIFRISQSQQHSVSIRGGSDELSYYTSLNYLNANGIQEANSYSNAGILMNLDYRPMKNLIIALQISANHRRNINSASAVDPLKYAVFANPYEKPYDENGNYLSDLSFIGDNYNNLTPSRYAYDRFNILRELRENRNTQTGIDASTSLDIKYTLRPGLILSLSGRQNYGYNYGSSEVNAGTYTSWVREQLARAAYPSLAVLPSEYDNGDLSESSGRATSWVIKPQLDYSLKFGQEQKHLFTFLAATEISARKFNNFGYTSPIYFSDYRITGLPAFPGSQPIPYSDLYYALKNLYTTTDGQDRSVSYISSITYNYADRYIFNLNLRMDGADVIGNKNQFTPLGSIGVRYNMHREPFFNKEIVNELSLRGSFGYTGIIDRSAYPFSVIELGDMTYMGNQFVQNYNFPNPTVKWARKKDISGGIDVSFLNYRVKMSLNAYLNRVDDVLSDLEVPSSTGRINIFANGGIVQNKGVELYIQTTWLQNKDWHINSSFNISRNSNKILRTLQDFSSFEEMLKSESTPSLGGIFNFEGEEIGGIYGWKTAGIDPATGNPRYYLTEKGKETYAEFLKNYDSLDNYKKNYYDNIISDKNNIPDIAIYDPEAAAENIGRHPWQIPSMQYLGGLHPKITGGFSTSVRYRSIEFSTLWTFKTGHLVPTFNDYQNAPRNMNASAEYLALGYSRDLAVSATNRQKKYLNYWQMPGDDTNVKRFVVSNYDLWTSMHTSDQYEKGDYLRMTNISLSYRFNQELIKKMHLNQLLIGLNATNLLTFTKYRGVDVATGSAFGYPVAKEFNVKLTLGF